MKMQTKKLAKNVVVKNIPLLKVKKLPGINLRMLDRALMTFGNDTRREFYRKMDAYVTADNRVKGNDIPTYSDIINGGLREVRRQKAYEFARELIALHSRYRASYHRNILEGFLDTKNITVMLAALEKITDIIDGYVVDTGYFFVTA